MAVKIICGAISGFNTSSLSGASGAGRTWRATYDTTTSLWTFYLTANASGNFLSFASNTGYGFLMGGRRTKTELYGRNDASANGSTFGYRDWIDSYTGTTLTSSNVNAGMIASAMIGINSYYWFASAVNATVWRQSAYNAAPTTTVDLTASGFPIPGGYYAAARSIKFLQGKVYILFAYQNAIHPASVTAFAGGRIAVLDTAMNLIAYSQLLANNPREMAMCGNDLLIACTGAHEVTDGYTTASVVQKVAMQGDFANNAVTNVYSASASYPYNVRCVACRGKSVFISVGALSGASMTGKLLRTDDFSSFTEVTTWTSVSAHCFDVYYTPYNDTLIFYRGPNVELYDGATNTLLASTAGLSPSLIHPTYSYARHGIYIGTYNQTNDPDTTSYVVESVAVGDIIDASTFLDIHLDESDTKATSDTNIGTAFRPTTDAVTKITSTVQSANSTRVGSLADSRAVSDSINGTRIYGRSLADGRATATAQNALVVFPRDVSDTYTTGEITTPIAHYHIAHNEAVNATDLSSTFFIVLSYASDYRTTSTTQTNHASRVGSQADVAGSYTTEGNTAIRRVSHTDAANTSDGTALNMTLALALEDALVTNDVLVGGSLRLAELADWAYTFDTNALHIVYNDTFTWSPAPGPQGSTEFNVISAQYDDGYKVTYADGLNNSVQTWDLVFNRSCSEAYDIALFLRRHKGGIPFKWTPPNGTEGIYTCEAYQEVPKLLGKSPEHPELTNAGFTTVSAKFKQTYLSSWRIYHDS